MGKRSNFKRIEKDAYQTIDPRAVIPLFPILERDNVKSFDEPCAGEGWLIYWLTMEDLYCASQSDINIGYDALKRTNFQGDAIITNPPWSRSVLHSMIDHFRKYKPTYLLFDSAWAYTKQAKKYLPYCSDIIAVGRLKWIPDTTMSGKDDCSWYKFIDKETDTQFHY